MSIRELVERIRANDTTLEEARKGGLPDSYMWQLRVAIEVDAGSLQAVRQFLLSDNSPLEARIMVIYALAMPRGGAVAELLREVVELSGHSSLVNAVCWSYQRPSAMDRITMLWWHWLASMRELHDLSPAFSLSTSLEFKPADGQEHPVAMNVKDPIVARGFLDALVGRIESSRDSTLHHNLTLAWQLASLGGGQQEDRVRSAARHVVMDAESTCWQHAAEILLDAHRGCRPEDIAVLGEALRSQKSNGVAGILNEVATAIPGARILDPPFDRYIPDALQHIGKEGAEDARNGGYPALFRVLTTADHENADRWASLALLQHSSSAVRARAARALTEAVERDRTGVAAKRTEMCGWQMLNDVDWGVRVQAARALRRVVASQDSTTRLERWLAEAVATCPDPDAKAKLMELRR